jgi:hypothetical protein
MGDDGYSGVNLGFSFPYYDKTFNQAYMYDNGVLSFLQPGTPDALSPWQWYSSPVNQAQGKYFIAPLWADIAPVPQTTYTTLGTATSQKFIWNNIAEYYSRGGVLRLNSFSVEINANGDIATKYFGLNLRTSNIAIGYKGNTDYTQIAYYPYGTVLSTQADWTANTKVTVTPTPTPTPVKQEPIPEPVIEQPVQEVVQETTQPAPVVAATTATTTTTVASTPAPAAAQPVATAEPVKTTEKKVAVKAQQVDMSVVDAAVAIAMTSATQSVNEQVVVSNNFSLSNSLSAFKQANNQTTAQRQVTEQVDVVQQTATNTEKKDALEFFILHQLDKQEVAKQEKERGINKVVKPVTELGPEIPLFSAYTQVMLQDSAFYLPKEIYKKQRVVDNQRLLRSLNNDAKFDELINIQYTR